MHAAVSVDETLCIPDCSRCLSWCPLCAISREDKAPAKVDPDVCCSCGECLVRTDPCPAIRAECHATKLLEWQQTGLKSAVVITPALDVFHSQAKIGKVVAAVHSLGMKAFPGASGIETAREGIIRYVEEHRASSRLLIDPRCGAVRNLLHKTRRDLLPYLIPTDSTLFASARRLKEKGYERVAAIGPDVAYKETCSLPEYNGLLHAVIPYTEFADFCSNFLHQDLGSFADEPMDEPLPPQTIPRVGSLCERLQIEGLPTLNFPGPRREALTALMKLDPTKDKGFVEVLICDCTYGPGIPAEWVRKQTIRSDQVAWGLSIDDRPIFGKRGTYWGSRQLGKGGTSTVFEAQVYAADADLPGRDIGTIALKVYNSSFVQQDRDGCIKRIERAIEVCGAVNSCHVAKVYAYDEICGENPTIAALMEMVKGKKLPDYTGSRPASEERITNLIGQLCDALKALHDLDCFHRDVKPDNVVIQNDGTLKLVDLGVIKAPWDPTITGSGEFLGTLRYAAPEWLERRENGNWRAVDMYGIGGVMYRLLTGKDLFANIEWQELVTTIRQLMPDFSEVPASPLRSICERLLSKNSEDRFPSVDSLMAALHP